MIEKNSDLIDLAIHNLIDFVAHLFWSFVGFEANQVCSGEVWCGVQEGNAKKLSSVRQLFHYMVLLDPLKGDALNKAVRDTAHEAISAIFSVDDFNKRIQGFGNINFEMPSDDKKSFLSEVVGIGSATIKQGLSSLTQAQSLKKNDTGSYKSPNLRRSLTNDRVEHQRETQTVLKECQYWILGSGGHRPDRNIQWGDRFKVCQE